MTWFICVIKSNPHLHHPRLPLHFLTIGAPKICDMSNTFRLEWLYTEYQSAELDMALDHEPLAHIKKVWGLWKEQRGLKLKEPRRHKNLVKRVLNLQRDFKISKFAIHFKQFKCFEKRKIIWQNTHTIWHLQQDVRVLDNGWMNQVDIKAYH